MSANGRGSVPRSGIETPDPEPISGLLEAVFEELGVTGKVRECQALLAWGSVAGPQLSQHARAVRVHRGRLQLAVPSAVWRTHLSFSKRLLVERINQRLGHRVIGDLVFVNRPIQDRAGARTGKGDEADG